jgi:hypothetical protein
MKLRNLKNMKVKLLKEYKKLQFRLGKSKKKFMKDRHL